MLTVTVILMADKDGGTKWPTKMASRNGRQRWRHKMVDKDGRSKWPTKMASRNGRQRWPLKMSDKDGVTKWPTKMAAQNFFVLSWSVKAQYFFQTGCFLISNNFVPEVISPKCSL